MQSFTEGAQDEVKASVPEHVPYSAALMEEAQMARGEKRPAPAQVKGKADVTPQRRRRTGLDELKEL
jgi:hypothetical protein